MLFVVVGLCSVLFILSWRRFWCRLWLFVCGGVLVVDCWFARCRFCLLLACGVLFVMACFCVYGCYLFVVVCC